MCPYCLHEYDDVGGCPCGERAAREEQESEAAQVNKKLARDWAKEYLPDGWQRYPWRMIKDSDGLITWQGRTLDIDGMAFVGCLPDGWHGVIVCVPPDNQFFNFCPPDEPAQLGPLPTEEAVTQALLYRFAQFEEQLEPIPPPPEKKWRMI